MGALVYAPDYSPNDDEATAINLDKLAHGAQEILSGASSDVMQALLALNGSSAGARPKAMVGLDIGKQNIIHGTHDLPEAYAAWIVKFANTQDGPDAGAIEYVYALMAKEAGLDMPDIHLFPAQKGAGYFAVKRFDRHGKKRLHMHTVCGLLHSDFRIPSLDYEDLIALTGALTRDIREVEKMVQRAIFNVLAHNRDDHSKNFSYLMDETGQWKLSPAYDITFSQGPNAEQSTMVMGMGRNPGHEHLLKLGKEAKLSENRMKDLIERVKTALAKWRHLAKTFGVSASNIDLIERKINQR
jgi:serine/threonine-protein kinase HipA